MELCSLFSLHNAQWPLLGQQRQDGAIQIQVQSNSSLGKTGPEKGNILLKVT